MDHVIISVDTHKNNHVAIDAQFGHVKVFRIEGTGSFGAGLSRYLLAKMLILVGNNSERIHYEAALA